MVEVMSHECLRCRYKWVGKPGMKKLPVNCPKCKSSYWDKPRKRNYLKPKKKE